MIKGIQKNVVSVRLSESRYFETAYFVMRRNAPPGRRGQGDMLSEAQRILREQDLLKKKPAPPRFGGWLRVFVLGALSGMGITTVFWLLFFLLP